MNLFFLFKIMIFPPPTLTIGFIHLLILQYGKMSLLQILLP